MIFQIYVARELYFSVYSKQLLFDPIKRLQAKILFICLKQYSQIIMGFKTEIDDYNTNESLNQINIERCLFLTSFYTVNNI